MFKLLGRKREAKETESKQPEARRGEEVTEDKGNDKPLVDLMDELVEQRSASSSASVRSILQAAISSAEQIVDSVKTRVVAEAKQEAAKIITEAQTEAEKIRSEKKPVRDETAGDTVSMVEQVAKELGEEPAPTLEEVVTEKEEPVPPEGEVAEPIAEEVTPQYEEPAPTLEEVVTEKEEPVPPEGEVAEPIAEEAMPQHEEPAIVEPTAEEIESEKAEEKREEVEEKAPEVVLTETGSQSLYTGQVELTVKMPLEPTMVANLYNYLQTTPEVKFVRTVGSWNKGSTITIVLDKPIPLISVLASKLPEADVVPEGPERNGLVRDRRGVRKISISLKNK